MKNALRHRISLNRESEESLTKNQAVLSLQDKTSSAEEALFNIGVIYAHNGYPKRDYQKSLEHFRRLVRIFPQSPFAGWAKIWIGIIQDNVRLKKEVEELNKNFRKSRQVDIDIDEKRRELSK